MNEKGKTKFAFSPPTCNRCGKEAPIDEKMSTENWTVYRVKEPCECGGTFKMNFDAEGWGDNE